MRRRIFLGFIFLLFLLMPVLGYSLSSIEVNTGYLAAELKDGKRYDLIPLCFAFNYDGAPALEKIGIFDYPGKIDFVFEPFVNVLVEYNTSFEVGTNLLMKYTYPLTEKFQPYLKVGAGMVYMGQKVDDQATRFNYLPQVGLGFHFFITDDVAFNLEGRFRHLSNCSIKHPNNGIDSVGGMVGISKFF